MALLVKPIGTVGNEVEENPGAEYNWQSVVSQITLDASLTEALDGIERFSHLIILWQPYLKKGAAALKVHPRSRHDIPQLGVFTTRSPHRPNALGKTTVEFLERKENTIKERGLNAVDGTPVLDIKPYTPDYDSAGNAHIPYWADPELEQR